MTINQVPSSTIEAKPAWKIRFGRVLRSRITFLVLQALDLLTTLAAFHVGAFEVNPLVARFTVIFGAFRGVLISKLIAVMIAMGIRRRLWIVNVFYTGIICWNLLVLFALAWKTH
jgi:hypothetical protein